MSDQAYCKQCGHIVDMSATFCTFCGASRRAPMSVAPALSDGPTLSDPDDYRGSDRPPSSVNPTQPSSPTPLYQPPNSAQAPYPPRAYPAQLPINPGGAHPLPYPQQQTGLDNGTIALAVLGFFLALVSLLFFPIFAGAGAIACGIKVRKKADVLGIVLLVVAVVCMVIGIVFGVVMGVARFTNHH